jgi:hypothetical protein
MTLCVLVSLDVVLPASDAADRACVFFPGYPAPAGFIGMMRPHVSIQILGLGAARGTKVAAATFGVVVHVLAVRLSVSGGPD